MQRAAVDCSKPVEPYYWDNYSDTAVGRYLFQYEYAFVERVLSSEVWLARSLNSRGDEPALLDVCCGSGRVGRPLHAAGLNVIGVDIDPVALASLRKRSEGMPIIRGNALDLPFADGSFDCIVAIQCFEYLEHDRFLCELNRVLRKGGVLVFDALNRHSYKAMKVFMGRALELPSANLSCREILRATANSGFSIKAVRGYNWIPFPRESTSNSPLVQVAARAEQLLKLDHYYHISPKILVAAKKRGS
jgi:SAM-dependent methyltransferase